MWSRLTLLALVLQCACARRGAFPAEPATRISTFTPESWPTAGWRETTPEEQGFNRSGCAGSVWIVRVAVGLVQLHKVLFGFPALAVVIVKYFTFEMESRRKSQHQQLAIDQRVQRLEEVLTSLDHDVRVRLGIDKPATPPPSHPELLEEPAAPDAQRGKSLDPSRTKAR